MSTGGASTGDEVLTPADEVPKACVNSECIFLALGAPKCEEGEFPCSPEYCCLKCEWRDKEMPEGRVGCRHYYNCTSRDSGGGVVNVDAVRHLCAHTDCVLATHSNPGVSSLFCCTMCEEAQTKGEVPEHGKRCESIVFTEWTASFSERLDVQAAPTRVEVDNQLDVARDNIAAELRAGVASGAAVEESLPAQLSPEDRHEAERLHFEFLELSPAGHDYFLVLLGASAELRRVAADDVLNIKGRGKGGSAKPSASHI